MIFRYIGEQYINSSNTEKQMTILLVDLGLNYKLNKTTTFIQVLIIFLIKSSRRTRANVEHTILLV